jgi:lantibiotic biosynthesis protein
VILQFAQWSLTKDDLRLIFDNSGKLTRDLLASFTLKWKMPPFCQYLIDRNTALLNWQDIKSVELFINNVKGNQMVTLWEFPVDLCDGFIKDVDGKLHHTECVALVKNKQRIKEPQSNYAEQLKAYLQDCGQEKYFPGDDWVYLKVYSSRTTTDKLLHEYLPALLPDLYDRQLVDKFFFIRYNDPEFHLRLRFHSTAEHKAAIVERLSRDLRAYTSSNLIWKMEFSTYSREVGRYGYGDITIAEDIFEADSLFWVNFNAISDKKVDYFLPVFFIKSAHELLNVFQISINDRFELISRISKAYEKEFGINTNKNFQKYLNHKEQDTRQIIERVLNGDLSDLRHAINAEKYKSTLDEFKERLNFLSVKHDLTGIKKMYLLEKLNSLVHMQATRCFKSKVRENELFAYTILNGYYKKMYYKSTTVIHEGNTA